MTITELFITEVFQVCLSRPPTPAELAAHVASAKQDKLVDSAIKKITTLPEFKSRLQAIYDAIEGAPVPVPVPPPAPTVPPVGDTVAFYQGVYDAEYQKNKPALDALAASGGGAQQYYAFQYPLMGTLSMYEATQNAKYLDQALAWVETMISKATVIDSSGKKNWPGPDKTYVAAGTSHQLWDLQGSTELARLARIILTTPTLTSAYGSRATTIYNFVRDHIVNKWLVTRGTLFWFDQQSTQTTKYFNDKLALLIRILVHLTAASAALGGADNTTFGYPSILLNMAQGFLDRKGGSPRFTAYQGGLIWDNGLGWNGPIPPNDPSTALDTSHANRYPYAMVDCYKAGIVFTLPHLLGVATLLTTVMWNQSLTSPAFTNQLNGDNLVTGGLVPWFLGNIYHGWVVLAEYDPQVLRVADAMLKAVLAGVRNPSLDVTNTMDGRMALSGHLAKVVA